MMTLKQFAKQAATFGALKSGIHRGMVAKLTAKRGLIDPTAKIEANRKTMAQTNRALRTAEEHYSGPGGARISRAEFRAKRQANPYTAMPGVPMAQKPLTPKLNA